MIGWLIYILAHVDLLALGFLFLFVGISICSVLDEGSVNDDDDDDNNDVTKDEYIGN